MCAHMGGMPMGDCAQHYAGPIPTVPHLHGGEVPPVIDGGPDAWFTSDGAYHGHGYYTHPGVAAAGNEAVYRYPNTQEAAMIWFHDHLLGATRLNVYAGLAGAYPLIDPGLALPTGLHPVGLQQGASGPVDYLVPLVLQDRMFDVNGQLFFPNVGINPEHPFWIPEFVGDTIVVNGKVWPFLNVQPKRYRFLFVNGSNARTYELFLVNPATKAMGPPIWQIGTDGGYLDAPVKIDPNALAGGQAAAHARRARRRDHRLRRPPGADADAAQHRPHALPEGRSARRRRPSVRSSQFRVQSAARGTGRELQPGIRHPAAARRWFAWSTPPPAHWLPA